MTSRYHLPDWVVDGLADGSVDHIDYAEPIVARVVMRDGSVRMVSTVVTFEIRAGEIDRMQAESSTILFRRWAMETYRDAKRPIVTGWTA